MAKTNRFHVKDFEENKIIVEEERKYRSSLALFFIRNGKLIFLISLLFSLTVFIIAIYLAFSNIKESSIVHYHSNGVVVKFDGTDNSILNGTPITEEYASKVFNNSISISDSNSGVVIKVLEKKLRDRTIIYYSYNTALIKYNDGSYMRVSSVNGKRGINDKMIIDSRATTKNATGKLEENNLLGISILYLSDGSIEVTKGDTTFFVRNSDITNTHELFYSNLSGVSLPINKEENKIYYSDGTVRYDDYIVVNNIKYNVKEEKNIYNNIKIIYYENGYAEVIKGELSILVKKSDHIVYDKDNLEIIDNYIGELSIKDIMDIKEITLNNTNLESAHYIIVLEETGDYKKHNIKKRLSNEFIRFSVYVNGKKLENNILENNLKGKNKLEGLDLNNNTYLLYEGNIDKLSTVIIKLGLWIDYEDITNEYMNSAFIGTVKVYIESLG